MFGLQCFQKLQERGKGIVAAYLVEDHLLFFAYGLVIGSLRDGRRHGIPTQDATEDKNVEIIPVLRAQLLVRGGIQQAYAMFGVPVHVLYAAVFNVQSFADAQRFRKMEVPRGRRKAETGTGICALLCDSEVFERRPGSAFRVEVFHDIGLLARHFEDA